MTRKSKREAVTVTAADVGTIPTKIVAGTVSAVGSGSTRAGGDKKALVRLMEGAMASAVQECFKRGIVDPDVIRRAQLGARDIILKGQAAFAEAQLKARADALAGASSVDKTVDETVEKPAAE